MRTTGRVPGILALLLSLPGATCGDSSSAPTTLPLEERIIGTWEWLRAVGGIAGEERTPETEELARTLTIRADGTIELQEGSELAVRTTYEFVPAVDLEDQFVSPRLRYALPLLGGFEEQIVGFDVDGETLVLMDPCCDGFTWFWERASAQSAVASSAVASAASPGMSSSGS